jgi:UDP-glucose 4-epimerase
MPELSRNEFSLSYMKTVVTGGAGFIGSHLCESLIRQGHEVWCVDNLCLGREENIRRLESHRRFHFERFDILHTARLDSLFKKSKVDTVFHLAANSDIQQGSIDHEIDLKQTFLTTYEVLQAMSRHKARRIFFASSSAVFGDTGTDKLHEDYGPVRPCSLYGAAKLAAEAYLSVFAATFGFQVWILRFPNVVGERSTHGVVHDFIRRLKENPARLEVLGNGLQKKPYLYVKDIVRAILLITEKAAALPAASPAVFHAAGKGLTTVREIAEMVVEEMGLEGIPVSYQKTDSGWAGDVPFYQYDNRKIARLGFKPVYTSTEAVRIAIQKILGKST